MHSSVEQALSILRKSGAAGRGPAEQVALDQACGRVLAEDVLAAIDLPPFDNSAMDGYALRHAEAAAGAAMPLSGLTLAGQAAVQLPPAHCQRITTGAPLPHGADTVVIREDASEQGGVVSLARLPESGANVRRRGEDYQAGTLALRNGTRLTPPHIGLLASFGMSTLMLTRRPRIRLFSTGDELVAPGHPLAAGQIHDSNASALAAALRSIGIDPVRVGHIADRRDDVRDALGAIEDVDLILTCGGVSAGEADLLPGVLAELGEVLLWKVQIKPGMPFLFGRIGNAFLCGLPGNPVSALVTALVLVRPLLDAMEGAVESVPPLRAKLAAPLRKRHTRTEFRRGFLRCSDCGQLTVAESPFQGSAMQRGLVEGDVLIELPANQGEWAADDPVRVHRMPWT